MRNFILSLILALGFAVCFAAPPPTFENGHQTETIVPETPDMPVLFSFHEMDGEFQPAPLVTGQTTEFYSYGCMISNDSYSDVDVGRQPEDILLSCRSKSYILPDVVVELIPLNHSSGGMPY